MVSNNRRKFLYTAAAGSAIIGGAGFETLLASAARDQFKSSVDEDLVRFRPEIEPIVRLIEETAREKCFDAVVDRMKSGLSYRQVMSALFLAGIRNIDSAHVGGNLHTVFVVHSAHQLGLDSSIDQRLLPMFWAIDYFKRVQEGGRQTRQMKPFQGKLPVSSELFAELETGCTEFNRDQIERAMVGLVRTRGAAEIAEPLWRLAARDFIPLGHKAIYMANAWRTLQTIGWRHAEPTLRSLSESLASYDRYDASKQFPIEKQCYNENWKLAQASVSKLPGSWAGQDSDPGFVKELLQVLRTGKHIDAATLVVERLLDGSIQAGSVWDAVHLAAGEIILRQSNIGSMHGITASNAVHFGFAQAATPETRLLLLLQGVGFVCHFIPFIESRGRPFPNRNLVDVEPAEIAGDQSAAIGEVLSAVSSEPGVAASRGLQYALQFDDHRPLLQAARRLVYAKGDESHRFKFAAAIFEDLPLVSPTWRPQMLAAATQYFCGPSMPDTEIMKKARAALLRLG